MPSAARQAASCPAARAVCHDLTSTSAWLAGRHAAGSAVARTGKQCSAPSASTRQTPRVCSAATPSGQPPSIVTEASVAARRAAKKLASAPLPTINTGRVIEGASPLASGRPVRSRRFIAGPPPSGAAALKCLLRTGGPMRARSARWRPSRPARWPVRRRSAGAAPTAPAGLPTHRPSSRSRALRWGTARR